MLSHWIQKLGIATAAALTLSACAANPPPNWAKGGSPLTIAPAKWSRADSTVEIRADGKVVMDGEAVFAIDAAGRVFETDGDPIALLQPTGHLVGTDARAMGYVGVYSSSAPGDSYAWLSIAERGELIRFDSDGDKSQDGYWQGCQGPQLRACMLVSHYVVFREWQRRPRMGIGIGIGMGMVVH